MTVAPKLAAIAAALCLTALDGAHAQPVKKYITPDGKTIYSDKPVPGAREAGEIAPPPMIDPSSPQQSSESAGRKESGASGANQRLRELSERKALIEAAQTQLEAAKKTLAEGKEPLPEERIGIAGGGSRLKDNYFERQKRNEQAVEDAQKRLEQVLTEP